jgi:hypothetical protein
MLYFSLRDKYRPYNGTDNFIFKEVFMKKIKWLFVGEHILELIFGLICIIKGNKLFKIIGLIWVICDVALHIKRSLELLEYMLDGEEEEA